MLAIEAFVELGRTWREAQLANFAAKTRGKGTAVKDEEIIEQIRRDLTKRAGRIDRVYDVIIIDDGVFEGKADQRISVGRLQIYEFKIDLDSGRFTYRMTNADEMSLFADTDVGFSEIADFAAKSGRAGKKLNCKPGNMQCGGKCQGGSRACPSQMDESERKAYKAAVGKVRSDKTDKTAKPKTEKVSGEKEPEDNGDRSSSTSEAFLRKSRLTGIDVETLERVQPLIARRKAGEDLTDDEDRLLNSTLVRGVENKRRAFLEDGSELNVDSTAALRLKGNRVISRTELSAAGIDPTGNLGVDEIGRIMEIRNGFDSFDDFLAAPPVFDKDNYRTRYEGFTVQTQLADRDITIYSGRRVAMTISQDGDVEFTVDGAFSLNDRDGGEAVPSSELKAMTRAFNSYAASNAGRRILYTAPTMDDERGDTRVKLYERRGFQIREDRLNEGGERSVLMVLDNRQQG